MDTHMDFETALNILREKVSMVRNEETRFEFVASTDDSVTIDAIYENSHRRTETTYKVFRSGEVEEIGEYTSIEGKEPPF